MMDNQRILDSIRALTEHGNAGLSLSKLLYEHNCYYLLSKITSANAYMQKFQRELPLNKLCIGERYLTCKEIFNQFSEENIPYAVIKGAVFSASAYRAPHFRKSGDIDILISRNNVDWVKEIMLNSGFIQGRVTENGIQPFSRRELLFQSALSHQTAPFIKSTDNPLCPFVNMDINMDIMWGESLEKADMDYVLEHTEPTELLGVEFFKLTPEMEFIAICLHHYKDMNSIYLLYTGSLKLSLFSDIYYYLVNCQPKIELLEKAAVQLNVCQYIYYCLYWTSQIFKDEVIKPYLRAFYSEKSESILNTFGLTSEEQRLWTISFSKRLFTGSLPEYFAEHLSPKDFEKIRNNMKLM